MRIAVLPNHIHAGQGWGARISLFEPPNASMQGSVGTGVIHETHRALGRSPAAAAWDFTAVALAVVAADRLVNRYRTSEDGWTREVDLTIAVTDAPRWTSLREPIEAAVRFLTGDVWNITFVPDGILPRPPARAVGARPETCVSLLSGGLDSLIGAIDLSAAGQQPLFVSNRVKGDCRKQEMFAAAVGATNRVLSLNHNSRTAGSGPEISQRPRSLAFLAFAILAATTLDRYLAGGVVDIVVPENGYISLNVPLTPLRAGSLSTRTTHPRFMGNVQEIFDRLGLRVRLINPYRHKTKGEMMQECANQALLTAHAPNSMSCGRGGRINRHCGQCLPCLVRRAAFFRHNGSIPADVTQPSYKHPAIGRSFASPEFAQYDDVVQALAAIDTIERYGARRWMQSTISAGRVADPEPYRDVAKRGLLEIKDFLHAAGLV